MTESSCAPSIMFSVPERYGPMSLTLKRAVKDPNMSVKRKLASQYLNGRGFIRNIIVHLSVYSCSFVGNRGWVYLCPTWWQPTLSSNNGPIFTMARRSSWDKRRPISSIWLIDLSVKNSEDSKQDQALQYYLWRLTTPELEEAYSTSIALTRIIGRHLAQRRGSTQAQAKAPTRLSFSQVQVFPSFGFLVRSPNLNSWPESPHASPPLRENRK